MTTISGWVMRGFVMPYFDGWEPELHKWHLWWLYIKWKLLMSSCYWQKCCHPWVPFFYYEQLKYDNSTQVRCFGSPVKLVKCHIWLSGSPPSILRNSRRGGARVGHPFTTAASVSFFLEKNCLFRCRTSLWPHQMGYVSDTCSYFISAPGASQTSAEKILCS